MHGISQFMTSMSRMSREVRAAKNKRVNAFDCMRAKHFTRNFSQEEAAFATLLANRDGYKRVLFPGAIPTLTQSGLLAVLLERQRYKAIQLAWRHARREKMRVALLNTLARLLYVRRARTLADGSAKPFIGTIPRHT
jgi:hypothetical protein